MRGGDVIEETAGLPGWQEGAVPGAHLAVRAINERVTATM